jgi:regulator of cell morphogenesis and NO signaling
MFLPSIDINPKSSPAVIVAADYRTADVFNRYNIQYCCGAKRSLETICGMDGPDLQILLDELRKITRITQLPSDLPFDKWDIDFLIDYIVNIHHHYRKETVPFLGKELKQFAEEHTKKYPFFITICSDFENLETEMLRHISKQEETLFPYLRQVAHAYKGNASFAGLLVRTLRKPIAKMMQKDRDIVVGTIHKFRSHTGNYTAPPHACTSHRVILSKLKELDNDLAQHIFLETEILSPRIIQMEKELLLR